MSNGFSLDFTSVFDEVKSMNKTPQELKKAADKAMEIVENSIKQEAPVKTHRLQRSVRRVSKVNQFGGESTAYVAAWYGESLNDGNSKNRKHVGWFDRAVDNSIEEASEEALKEIGW